jgi:adenine phosphoribosyltransferase
MDFKAIIRDIPDYPKKGILFKDITTLLKDSKAFQEVINVFYEKIKSQKIDKIIGIESRGFIFGAPLAYKLNVGFIPIRKKGKLPGETISVNYDLEYGTDQIEIHTDALKKGERVILIDDLIATGGTALAAIELINKMEVEIIENLFLIDLTFLGGSQSIKKLGHKVFSICNYEGE